MEETLIDQMNDHKQETFTYPIDKINNAKAKYVKRYIGKCGKKLYKDQKMIFNKWKNYMYFNSNLHMENWLSTFQCTKYLY